MIDLSNQPMVRVRQRRELAELIGFETRNKYEIQTADGRPLGFAAEQGKGFLGLLTRGFLGHWRRFEIHIFSDDRSRALVLRHPFRWFFQRLEVTNVAGELIGSVQQRFAILSRRFDLEDEHGKLRFQMRAGIFSFWTFPIYRGSLKVAIIEKKWSGLLKEAFTDGDHFEVHFKSDLLTEADRQVILGTALFVDLQYFERKAR